MPDANYANHPFAVAITSVANENRKRYSTTQDDPPLLPEQLEDIDVRWDPGSDTTNEDYGYSEHNPVLEINVTWRLDAVTTVTREVEPGYALGALFRLALGMPIDG